MEAARSAPLLPSGSSFSVPSGRTTCMRGDASPPVSRRLRTAFGPAVRVRTRDGCHSQRVARAVLNRKRNGARTPARRQGRDHETDDHDRAGARRHGAGSAGRSPGGCRSADTHRDHPRRAPGGASDGGRPDGGSPLAHARAAPHAARHHGRGQGRPREGRRLLARRRAPRAAGLLPRRAARRDPQGPPRAGARQARGLGRHHRRPAPRGDRLLRVRRRPVDGHRQRASSASISSHRAPGRRVGGTGNPAAAPEAEQDKRAAMLYAQQGSSPWPVCGQ